MFWSIWMSRTRIGLIWLLYYSFIERDNGFGLADPFCWNFTFFIEDYDYRCLGLSPWFIIAFGLLFKFDFFLLLDMSAKFSKCDTRTLL